MWGYLNDEIKNEINLTVNRKLTEEIELLNSDGKAFFQLEQKDRKE